MRRFREHCRRLWPRHPLLPALPLPLYTAAMALRGELRIDHIVVTGTFLVLAYAHPKTKQFLVSFLGFVLIAVLYDAGRFIRDLGVSEGRVIGCGLYEFERSWLGIAEGGHKIALQDFFLTHHHPVADVFFAIPYAVFIAVSIGYAIYLFVTDPRACARFSWAFFVLNVLGMLTYHLLPCAPPWYAHRHGCAIHLNVAEYEGDALARVDAMTGVAYFRAFYGRAAEVFGALPSLHVAYPLLIVLEGWRRHGLAGRAASIFFFVWMGVAAIYLDHHWITDVVLGAAYAVLVFVALAKALPSPAPSKAPGTSFGPYEPVET